MGKFFPPKLDIKNFKLKDWKNGKPRPEDISKNGPGTNPKPEETEDLKKNNSRKQLNISSYNKRNTTFSVSKEPIKETLQAVEQIPVF